MEEATQARTGRFAPASAACPRESTFPRSAVCRRRGALGKKHLAMEFVPAHGLR